ncbi:MAG TPA: hypothetical protein VN648_13525 [Candidatus Methylomirabilis sp.]|nr:hypothetical protein [Candidatus Methylomirabilis sp.]
MSWTWIWIGGALALGFFLGATLMSLLVMSRDTESEDGQAPPGPEGKKVLNRGRQAAAAGSAVGAGGFGGMSDPLRSCVRTQPSGKLAMGIRAAACSLLLISAFCANLSDAAWGVSDQCRALAEFYARTPDDFTPQELAALHGCLATERPDSPRATASPSPPAGQRAGGEWLPVEPSSRQPQRARGEWPSAEPWSHTSEPWPRSWPWEGESPEREWTRAATVWQEGETPSPAP